jgi:F0F1-type ATP synthase delta subunit
MKVAATTATAENKSVESIQQELTWLSSLVNDGEQLKRYFSRRHM